MKNISIQRVIKQSLFILLMTFPLQGEVIDAGNNSLALLKELRSNIKETKGKVSDEIIDTTATKFSTLVESIDFLTLPDIESTIDAAADVAVGILYADAVQKLNLRDSNHAALAVVDKFLAKILSAIDKNWTFIPVSVNISPPAGVPMATSGMNPAAIADPKLRQQYLDLMGAEQAKNLKNGQQSALRRSRLKFLWRISGMLRSQASSGWTKADILFRFGKDKECKAILEKRFERAGN